MDEPVSPIYLKVFALSILTVFVLYTRLRTVFNETVEVIPSDPVFTSSGGYESYRNIQYSSENYGLPIISDHLANFPLESSFSSTGILESMLSIIAIPLQLFVSSEVANILVLYSIGPISAVITVILVYKIATKLFNYYIGILSAAILSFIPGQFVEVSVYGSGSMQPVEGMLLFAFILSLIGLIEKSSQIIVLTESFVSDAKENLDYTFSLISTTVLFTLLAANNVYTFTVVFTIIILTSIAQVLLKSNAQRGVFEPFIVSLIPVVSIGTVAVTVFYLLGATVFSGLIPVISILSTVMLVGFLFAEKHFESKQEYKYTPRNVYTGIFAGILGLITIIALYVYPQSFDWLRLMFGTELNDSTQFLTGRQPLMSTDVSQILFDNFGILFIVAAVGVFGQTVRFVRKVLSLDKQELFGVQELSLVAIMIISALYSTNLFSFVAPVLSIFAAYGVYYLISVSEILQIRSRSDVKTYHVLIGIIIVSSFIPALILPTDGTAVAESDSQMILNEEWVDVSGELQERTPESTDPYDRNAETDYGVIGWANHSSSIIAGVGERPVTGSEASSAELTSNYLLSDDETEVVSNNDEITYIAIDYQMTHPFYQFGWMTESHTESEIQDYYTQVFDSQTNQPAFELYNDKYYNTLLAQLYHYHGSSAEPQPVVTSFTQQEVGVGEQTQRFDTTFTGFDRPRDQHIQRFDSMEEAEEYIEDQRSDSIPGGETGEETNGDIDPVTEDEDIDFEDQIDEEGELPWESGSGDDNGAGGQIDAGTHQIGGIGINPTTDIPALEHHRYVISSETTVQDTREFQGATQRTSFYAEELQFRDVLRDESAVKIFEQVEGATISGEGPSETELIISVELTNENSETPFNYVQRVTTDEEGEFTATVPYSTVDTPEEYTIQADDSYQIIGQQFVGIDTGVDDEQQLDRQLYYGELDISEEAVQNGSTVDVVVDELSDEELEELQGQQQPVNQEQPEE